MKNKLLYLFLFLSIILLVFSINTRYKLLNINLSSNKSYSTNITVDKRKIDLGKVNDRSLASGEFIIRNVGENDLVINKVEVSCSCSSSTLIEKSISPNDTIKVKVQYNKKSKGYFYSDVIIHGNFSGSPEFLSFEGYYNGN